MEAVALRPCEGPTQVPVDEVAPISRTVALVASLSSPPPSDFATRRESWLSSDIWPARKGLQGAVGLPRMRQVKANPAIGAQHKHPLQKPK